MHSHCQVTVWNQAHSPNPNLPPVTEMEWMDQSVSVTATLSATYPEILQGYNIMWYFERVS